MCLTLSQSLTVAVLGFELPEYFVSENDDSLTVLVMLKQGELNVPVSVQVHAEDISTSKFV